ncbi:hypothetical protein BDR04DRAFT_1163805 [Suillus decipiens]|nr:hypothetical protein BDR04DRAFT_1163805 [Suillus decipiens]
MPDLHVDANCHCNAHACIIVKIKAKAKLIGAPKPPPAPKSTAAATPTVPPRPRPAPKGKSKSAQPSPPLAEVAQPEKTESDEEDLYMAGQLNALPGYITMVGWLVETAIGALKQQVTEIDAYIGRKRRRLN